MAGLVDLPTWPYVVILTDEEHEALRREGEVEISMFDLDPAVLDLYFGGPA